MSIIKKLYESSICEEMNLRYDFQLDKEVSKVAEKISPDIQEEEIMMKYKTEYKMPQIKEKVI